MRGRPRLLDLASTFGLVSADGTQRKDGSHCHSSDGSYVSAFKELFTNDPLHQRHVGESLRA